MLKQHFDNVPSHKAAGAGHKDFHFSGFDQLMRCCCCRNIKMAQRVAACASSFSSYSQSGIHNYNKLKLLSITDLAVPAWIYAFVAVYSSKLTKEQEKTTSTMPRFALGFAVLLAACAVVALAATEAANTAAGGETAAAGPAVRALIEVQKVHAGSSLNYYTRGAQRKYDSARSLAQCRRRLF